MVLRYATAWKVQAVRWLLLATIGLSATLLSSAADNFAATALQLRVLVLPGDVENLEAEFQQGKFNQSLVAHVPLRDRRKPPYSAASDYSAQVAFTGCSADSAGKCRADVMLTAINSNGVAQVAQGWLRLWHGSPPAPGQWALSEDTFGGLLGYPAPTGPYELIAIARDQVSGRLVVQTAPFPSPVGARSRAFTRCQLQ
jgi:hypothetical protein